MTEYGRIHTDGSRSGGQPLHSDVERVARALAQADGIEICSDATYALSSYGHKAQAALAAMRQPAKTEAIEHVIHSSMPIDFERRYAMDNLIAQDADLIEKTCPLSNERDAGQPWLRTYDAHLKVECPRCCGNGQTYGPNSGEDIICPDCNGKGRI